MNRLALHCRLRFPAMATSLREAAFSGTDPHSLALTLPVGVAMGIMPLLWGTTLLCIVAARLLKLNHLALQTVNYLCYPLQVAMLIPFYKLGTCLLPWGPEIPADAISGFVHGQPGRAAALFAAITLKALAAWLAVVPPAALAGYLVLAAYCRRRSGQRSAARNNPVLFSHEREPVKEMI